MSTSRSSILGRRHERHDRRLRARVTIPSNAERGRRAVRPPQARHGYASDSKPSATALRAAAAGRRCPGRRSDPRGLITSSRSESQHLGHAHHRFQLDILDVTGEQSGNRRLGHAQLPRDG